MQAAEDRYGREVLAHAESIKAVENLRQELAAARIAARDASTAADTAKAKLSTSEESWSRQKESLDKEAADLNTRYVYWRTY